MKNVTYLDESFTDPDPWPRMPIWESALSKLITVSDMEAVLLELPEYSVEWWTCCADVVVSGGACVVGFMEDSKFWATAVISAKGILLLDIAEERVQNLKEKFKSNYKCHVAPNRESKKSFL